MKKYALVCAYFGKWPVWITQFLATAAANPQADFYLYTDCGPLPGAAVPNVFVKEATLDGLFNQARLLLNDPIPGLKELRQVCNMKPFYGLLYAEDLKPYEFWGFIDIDVFYGDLNQFITDDLLRAYDVISTARAITCGHFCLFRNEERINRLILDVSYLVEYLNLPVFPIDEVVLGGHLIAHRHVRDLRLYFKEMVYDDNLYTVRGRKHMEVILDTVAKTVKAPLLGKQFAYVHFQDSKKIKTYFSKLSPGVLPARLLLKENECIALNSNWQLYSVLVRHFLGDAKWLIKYWVKKIQGIQPYPLE